MLDLRSDTVTRPTAGMRQAMASAEVGDDVFGDDPTVNLLQEEVAQLLGKAAALLVPSGTMSNQIALLAQTHPGQQVVLEAGAHIYRYEAGAPAALAGVLIAPVEGEHGALTWAQIEAALNPDDLHAAPPALICLENTHNRSGGRIFPQPLLVEIGREAHARNLRVHLDGARLWNAHVATGLPLAELAAPADTVSVCFSKALGAPVGSLLAGDGPTIARARRCRKMLGGGMRQAGILAAACRYALAHHLPRLADDHARARRLAASLANPLVGLDHEVQTNIVILRVSPPATAAALLAYLKSRGILGVGFGPGRVRLVPHLDIDDHGLDLVIGALNDFTGAAA
jgi:threonine aldolase